MVDKWRQVKIGKCRDECGVENYGVTTRERLVVKRTEQIA